MACSRNSCNSRNLCCTKNNVCEKTCIEVDKVFDVCMQQRSIPATLTVTFSAPPDGYTITSLINSAQGVISGLIITPIEGSQCSRVRYTLTVPIIILATNSAGAQITGTATMTITQDIMLRVPGDAVIAPEIKAIVSIEGALSQITSPTTVVTEACVTIITKVVADVILVIPSYGYPKLRSCQEFTEDVCPGVFARTTLFPS